MRVAPAFAFIVVFLAASPTLAAEPTERANPYGNLFNAQLSAGKAPALPARPVLPFLSELCGS